MADMTLPVITKHRWLGLSKWPKDHYLRDRVEKLTARLDWNSLLKWAAEVHKPCKIEPDFTFGGRHLVRRLKFTDSSEGILRIRMSVTDISDISDISDSQGDEDLLMNELHCIELVQDQSTVPIPQVFGYVSSSDRFKAPLMLMECLPGTVAMDLNLDFIPEQHKASFFEDMATIHIGSIIRLDDGSYSVGPIPGIGGPFKTAKDFFIAQALTAQFTPRNLARINKGCGVYADEIVHEIEQFPKRLTDYIERLSFNNNHGPFPLQHHDFGHNNMIVDEATYKILDVIDWEGAYSAPVDFLEFPLLLQIVPRAMDPPWNYGEDGLPTDEASCRRLDDRKEYVKAVLAAEDKLGLPPWLSGALADDAVQDLN